jgi:hypothetical protein
MDRNGVNRPMEIIVLEIDVILEGAAMADRVRRVAAISRTFVGIVDHWSDGGCVREHIAREAREKV